MGSLYSVKRNNADELYLEKIVSGQGSSGIPVGTLISSEGSTTPTNFLRCDGSDTTGTDSELKTYYPALYAYLGGTNTLPYISDKTSISDYEEFTCSTNANAPTECPYDGFINVANVNGYGGYIYVNGVRISGNATDGGGVASNIGSITVKKGDLIYGTIFGATWPTLHARWYKSTMIIKATSGATDKSDLVSMDVVQEYVFKHNNLYPFENITPAGLGEANAVTMPYDGFLSVNSVGNGSNDLYIKPVGTDTYIKVSNITGSGGFAASTGCMPVHKGDMAYMAGSWLGTWWGSFYKDRSYS